MSLDDSLHSILIEQYTIAEDTLNLAKDIGLTKALRANSLKFAIDELDLALTVDLVLQYLIDERRY